MPSANKFKHQVYTDAVPTSPHRLLRAESCPPAESADARRRLANAGRAFKQAGVSAIYLVHGTFAGYDALGVLTELGRVFPGGRDAIANFAKLTVDAVAGDAGNYTHGYAERLQAGLADGGPPQILVRNFAWASENHHLGRAHATIRLLAELASLDLPDAGRVLLWGHSHAGNVFALLTNLLSGDRESVRQFFGACQVFYRWPFTSVVDLPVWRQVADSLLSGSHPFLDRRLDMVTFGTPIRYGWDELGCGRLLHFVNHRPQDEANPHRAAFPTRLDDVLRAAGGDYVQQVAIAGTNAMPSPLAWRAWTADRNLNRLLQPEYSAGNLLPRLKLGARVPDRGTTLLVDYGLPQGNVVQHLAGHAVYTRHDWMLFHAEQVARALYGPGTPALGDL